MLLYKQIIESKNYKNYKKKKTVSVKSNELQGCYTILVTQNPNTLSVILKSCCKLLKSIMYGKLNANKKR